MSKPYNVVVKCPVATETAYNFSGSFNCFDSKMVVIHSAGSAVKCLMSDSVLSNPKIR